MNKGMPSAESGSIEQLPDAVLLLVLSFLPTLAEIARTSILSQRWRNLWPSISCLDFDATTVLPLELLETSHDWYVAWVNKVIDARAAMPQLPFVKEFRIQYELDTSQRLHIGRWIDFAVANRVETLHLELAPYTGLVHRSHQYELSEESWYRAPSGLSSLKCLKSLFLFCVNVSERFLDFILSSCPLLEDLSLNFSGTHSGWDISGAPPLRLKRLKIATNYVELDKLCAPYLTSLFYESQIFDPQKIEVPMLNDLTIGSFRPSEPITKYLEHFWTYLPQLERLELTMIQPQRFEFIQFPELVKLKYLKMSVDWNTDLIVRQIIKFINCSPLLKIFAFEELWSEAEKSYSFKCLKVLELYGGNGKPPDQELVKCVVRMSPNLEKVIVKLRNQITYSMMHPSKPPEILRVAEAKAKELCQERPQEIEITIVG